MSQSLTPKELAFAAAQGVAIALKARKTSPEGVTDEFYKSPIIVCGLPPGPMYEVELKPDGNIAVVGESGPRK